MVQNRFENADIPNLVSRIAALEQLIEVYENSVLQQTDKLRGEIAERRRIQEELEFRNLVLSTQEETSLDGILVADENGLVIFYNRRFLDLWGFDSQAVKSKLHVKAMQPVAYKLVDPEGFLARLGYLYEHRDEKSRDELLFNDGRVIDRYTAPMFGVGGKYYGRVWYLRDITERVTADKVLKESEEKLRSIADTAQDAIIMVDNDGHILFWNKAAEMTFGYDNGEVTGKIMHPLIIPQRLQNEHLKGFSRFRTTGEGALIGKTVEVQALRKDGSEFPMELSLSGVKLKGRWCAVGIARDITDRKRTEEALKKLNSELKVLYEVSQAIGRTLDMDEFLPAVLHILAEAGILPFEIKGAIFLAEDHKLRLASFVNLSEKVLEPCAEVQPGECLCGMALVTEEIIVSKISEGEPRDIRCQHEMTPHGHIIVPLKAIGRVVGVLSLYIEYDVDVTEGLLKLLLSIGSSIGIAVNNARLYEETKSFSLHDPLTGLANRRSMDIQMDKGLDAAGRYEEEFSVIMADIDHFKRYNDEHGHQEGDKLLKKVADILSLEVRRADCVFRYGGEEFLIILPKTGPATAFEAAERLRKAVQQEAGITISLGIASLTLTDQRKEDLIDHADKALYRAKEGGRNRVESASTAKP